MTRLLIALAIGVVVSFLTTQFLISWLTRLKIGQPIQEDGPQGHQTKAGTPTMGGAAIVAGAAGGYAISDLWGGIYTRTGLITMFTIIAAGAVGFLDDWIKISRERNLGLTSRAKFIGLTTVAVLFAVMMINFTDVHTELSFTRWDSFGGFDLGPWGWGAFAVLTILATSNAVNLTDGLDGLAAGSSIFGFAAYTAMTYWMFRNSEVYDVPHALDIAIVSASLLAGTAGFLWFNAAPARIFMGDTGSLALGTALAAFALSTNTALLLPIIGGLFVIETLSVIIQVAVFKATKKRVFRMAPIHHHFELKGWPETWVIIRFWMAAGLLTAVALGLFYADFINVSEGA